jgi:2-amino-4-hydroxy-6-hydroxymethyldihydropteridine diphosphokinase
MVLLETTLDPGRFLKALQQIEDDNGRTRGERWGPRTLDLDIVRYGTRRLRDPELQVPHPEMLNRDWWQREMVVLARLAPPGDPEDA